MANILTFIELEGQQASQASLSVLNQSRLIASKLGATSYALLTCPDTPSYGEDDIIAVLSKHGADKVILITDSQLVPPVFFSSHGVAVKTACSQLPPKLMLFPTTSAGQDIAARMAIILGAHFASNARLVYDDGFQIVRHVFRRQYIHTQPLIETVGSVVLTLTTDEPPVEMGNDEAEVVVVHVPSSESALEIQGPKIPASPDISSSRLVVAGGKGLKDRESFELLERLARALGGVPAASRSACDAGLADRSLQVGIDGSMVDADYYLAFGVSGSPYHLACLGPHTRVLAVNSDPGAPVFNVAKYQLVADATETIKAILANLDQLQIEEVE